MLHLGVAGASHDFHRDAGTGVSCSMLLSQARVHPMLECVGLQVQAGSFQESLTQRSC